MAYARRKYARRPNKTRRSYKGKTRYSKKKKVTRRAYRRPMTKRSILNVTSKKKRDTMLSYTNYPAGVVTTPTQGPTTFTGSQGEHVALWCATARVGIETAGANQEYPIDDATRTATTCFMRGLSHVDTIVTSTNDPWYWRRIVFATKNENIQVATANNPITLVTSGGYVRVHNVDSALISPMDALLFKGYQGSDWTLRLLAPVDTLRVDLMSDKTTMINSASGPTHRRVKQWYPMNKNLVYDDDEQGGGKSMSNWSVSDKRGMGDVWIYDLFGSLTASTGQLKWSSEATLYWHEK